MPSSSSPAERGPDSPSAPAVVLRRAVRRFLGASLLAGIVLATGTVLVSRQIAGEAAIRDARLVAEALARSMVSAHIEMDPAAGGRPISEAVEGRLRHEIAHEDAVHIKLWAPSGRVLWADDPAMQGRTFVLPEQVRALFGTSGSVAELPEADTPKIGAEPDEGAVLEVYVGTHDVDGDVLVLETYTSPAQLAARTELMRELAPVGVAALLLLLGATLPLALSLARRVDREHRRRAELLQHTYSAWERERRRIAEDLHDGVVQSLAGVGYVIPTLTRQLPEGPESEHAKHEAARLSHLLITAVSSLREVVGDLAHDPLAQDGLSDALRSLADAVGDDGLEVGLHLDPDARLGAATQLLVVRTVREGLRNVVKHARARSAEVSVTTEGDVVVVAIRDDGIGHPSEESDHDAHVGLELLDTRVRRVGGRLVAGPHPDGGFLLTVTMPVDVGE